MRPNWHEYMLALAAASAERSACQQKRVGAVVANDRHVIVGTGYNGLARGVSNCTSDDPCHSAKNKTPKCAAVHAEINALLCAGASAVGGTIAITTTPCLACAGAIINAGIVKVIAGCLWKRHEEEVEGTGWSPGSLLRAAGIDLHIPVLSPDVRLYIDALSADSTSSDIEERAAEGHGKPMQGTRWEVTIGMGTPSVHRGTFTEVMTVVRKHLMSMNVKDAAQLFFRRHE